jgi:hypothetical protein
MAVGNLGNLEIVLVGYDDGDVAAYYTHAIVRCLKATSDQSRGTGACRARQTLHPKPFFHENVGKSAWGLAIHEQSRLIAVGSNLHEVTVFAFAVNRNKAAVKFPEVDNSPRVATGQTALELQKQFQSRTRTWRITLPLGHTGNNIPNLDFIDDEAGEADKVAAIDIAGSVWILDIWKIGALPIHWRDDPDTDLTPGMYGILFHREPLNESQADTMAAREAGACWSFGVAASSQPGVSANVSAHLRTRSLTSPSAGKPHPGWTPLAACITSRSCRRIPATCSGSALALATRIHMPRPPRGTIPTATSRLCGIVIATPRARLAI